MTSLFHAKRHRRQAVLALSRNSVVATDTHEGGHNARDG